MTEHNPGANPEALYTEDGKRIKLTALVEKKEHLAEAIENGAEGAGLLCVGSFFEENNDLPSEDEQYEFFSSAARAMRGRPVTVRVFDWAHRYFEDGPGLNPSLGLRGVRLALAHPRVLITQLRAIMRAGIHGDFNLLLPMVSHVTEVTAVKENLKEARDELESRGVPCRLPPEVGIMADIPAVLAAIEAFCFEVKFFHLGKDAITYLYAADPENQQVSGILNNFDSAYLAQIQTLVEKAYGRHKRVGISAPLVKEPSAIPVLIGMGMDELVVPPALLSQTRELVRCLDSNSTKLIASKAISYWDPEKSKKYCEDCLRRIMRKAL